MSEETAETVEVRAWDPALVDWRAVHAGVAEHQADCEVYIAQLSAEVRARGRRRLVDQEALAAAQANADVCAGFLAHIERTQLA